ncbi:MAG: hypothetical protein RI531_08955, partial [Haloferacaceae archaeon]|nr:hypothetical protein [Haloferacaceae archaeon]
FEEFEIGDRFPRAVRTEVLERTTDVPGEIEAALYAAAKLTNQPVTQADVSAVTDMSEVTIRNRYQELLAAYDRDRGGADGDAAAEA